MSDKQIFAALEVADHEVRLIVGEFFNTRFNIIKVERVPVSGLSDGVVEEPELIVKAITKAAIDAEKSIGARIEKVILGLPSYGIARKSVKSTVVVDSIEGTITVQDIRKAIKKAQTVAIDKSLALIQTVCVKYTINGISSRRIPIGEKANELTVDIDLICTERKLAFDLVNCVEQSGLQVMDIFIDTYGISKEAALFEQSVDQNVVILKMERNSTTLGLLSKGRLTSGLVEPIGVGYFASNVIEEYGMSALDASELIKYSIRLGEKVYSDNPVYIWQNKGVTTKISEKELWSCIQPKVEDWINAIEKLCSPILQAGKTTVIITGEGGEIQNLNTLLQRRLKCEVRNYIPETLGGRNAGLTACLGLFYAYKDKMPIIGMSDNSLDMDAFIKSVSYRESRSSGNQEDTITRKLKGILFDGKK